MREDPRRLLPSMSVLLGLEVTQRLIRRHGRETVLRRLRDILQVERGAESSVPHAASPVAITEKLETALRSDDEARVRRVINATGVILHTNLGRARLSGTAIDAMVAMAGPCTVEYDPLSAKRSSRGRGASALLRDLVGAEDCLVVNNAAAALVLALVVVGRGRNVIVSRGELIEIGGSFRLPDMIRESGVGLTEVGTTNRTFTEDYVRAVRDNPDAAGILRVHPSNYRVIGFSHRPSTKELAVVARNEGLALIDDVGSGLLHSNLPIPDPIRSEPTIRDAVADGADLVIASGDKLLGGPQSGLLVGRGRLVEQCRRHPLARAFRMDKLRLAALEETLLLYQREAVAQLPTWSMILAESQELRSRAQLVVRAAIAAGLQADVVEVESVVGGGTTPGVTLPSVAVAIPDPSGSLATHLVNGSPPVIPRMRDEVCYIDLRSIGHGEEREIGDMIRAFANGQRPDGTPI